MSDERPLTPRTERLLQSQAAYFVVTGLWPLAHFRSFEAVTGPKASPWLVKTFGALVAVIGAALAASLRRGASSDETRILSIGSALALGAADVRYATSGRISKVYLADAAAHAMTLAAWGSAGRGQSGE
jgi:hypothetical protein